MNRNTESRFSKVPVIKTARSSFPINHTHLTTMNAGRLVPFYVQECLPGDTFSFDMATLVRLSSTAIHPTMDNMFMDTYFFWVPNRIIYDNWKKFMGESPEPWVDSNTYTPPYDSIGSGWTIAAGSILNYLGIPAGSYSNIGSANTIKYSILPLNAYCLIWNYYFRVQALQAEVPIYKGDGALPSAYSSSYLSFVNKTYLAEGDTCLPVAKSADYFVSCLPSPQKGPDVLIPAGGSVRLDPNYNMSLGTPTFKKINDITQVSAAGAVTVGSGLGQLYSSGQSSQGIVYDPGRSLLLDGLEVTVNNLRLAIQTQRLLEKDARGGSFYNQILKNHFNIDVNSNVIDIPEYLGGKRIPINMLEVTQTSETSSTSPLGNLAGKSVTADRSNMFTKSFVEHGFIIGVCCIRSDHTYSQGIERMFTQRDDRLKYYWPVFAHLGEQPVYNSEIQANCSNKDDVFGYQEAWAEYRYKPNRISGYFSPQITGSLSSWHYGDYYTGTTAPQLSDAWIRQGTSEIDRTIAVPSSTMHQFLVDFYVKGKMVRAMPVYSIPGLMDHE